MTSRYGFSIGNTPSPAYPMFFTVLLVCVVLCAIILYLPYAAGLTQIEKNHRTAEVKKTKKEPQFHGYIPLDEELRQQEEEEDSSRASAIKKKFSVTSDDMPVRIRLNQDSTLRKRQDRTMGDRNPDTYDYDLDELIREETEGQAAKSRAEFYANENIGGDKEAMV